MPVSPLALWTTSASTQDQGLDGFFVNRLPIACCLATWQGGDEEALTDAMARIYVWLRYSAARQLTWQRNYNTQPRILGEAQRRLTHQIAEVGPAMPTCDIVLCRCILLRLA